MLSEPGGKFVFGQVSSGESEYRLDGIAWREIQCVTIDGEEQAGDNPCCPLVAIYKGVVTRDAERVSRRQRRWIILAIMPLIDGAAQGRFEHP